MYSKYCLEYDSVPKTDLECVTLKPNSSNNRIQQLLETSEVHHPSKFNISGTCPNFHFISEFSGHQLEKKKEQNTNNNIYFKTSSKFPLKFDHCNTEVQTIIVTLKAWFMW